MKFSIRTKLLIGFALLLTLSSLIQTFSFSITRDYIYSQISNSQLNEANKGANTIQAFFKNLSSINFGLAHTYKENISTPSASSSSNFVYINEYTIKNNDHIKKISYLTPAGRELYKFDEHGQMSQDQLNYELFTEEFKSAASGKTTISKVYYLDKELGPHIDIFTPIFLNNTVSAVIKMQISLENLRLTLADIKVGDNGYVYVVDEKGRLIAHPSQQFLSQRPNLSKRKVITAALQGKELPRAAEVYKDEKNTIVAAKAVKISGINWVVVFEQPISEVYGFLDFTRNLFIFTLISSSLLLLLIALFISENLTRSIRTLEKATTLLEKGMLDKPINIKTGDEIESLAESFNLMTYNLLQWENSLKKEKREMEILLQSLTDGVIALDQNFTILLFNNAAEKITGLAAKAVISRKIDEVLYLYMNDKRIQLSTSDITSQEFEKKLLEKGLNFMNLNGKKISISVTISPLLFDDKTHSGWIMTFRDTTKDAELEEMKIDFVSMAAHELRTPLTAIRGYASLLLEVSTKLTDEERDYVKRLIINSENLASLIDNLLNVSKIERNQFNIVKAPLDLAEIIKSIVEGLKELAKTKSQTLELNIPNDKLPIVMADKFRISQVIANLVSNALNYTPEKGKIIVTVDIRGDYLQVAVADNGRGIPKDAIPKLFTKFFRVAGKLEQGSKGTGLGLFISRSIIDMHRGKIWVESEEGKGTTFTFVLPLAKPEEIAEYQEQKGKTTLTGQHTPGIINRDLNTITTKEVDKTI